MCDTSSNRGNSSKTRCIKGCKVVSVIHHTGGCKGLQSCQCYTPHRWYETYNERVSFFFLIQDLNVER